MFSQVTLLLPSLVTLSTSRERRLTPLTLRVSAVTVLFCPSPSPSLPLFTRKQSQLKTAGEMLQVAEPFLHRNMHPRTIVSAYNMALVDAEETMKKISLKLDVNDNKAMLNIINSTIGTKFVARYGDLICKLALTAVKVVAENIDLGGGKEQKSEEKEDESQKDVQHAVKSLRTIIDTKRFARVERIPGGAITDSCVLDGIIINKDVLHPKMRRRIENPRILWYVIAYLSSLSLFPFPQRKKKSAIFRACFSLSFFTC